MKDKIKVEMKDEIKVEMKDEIKVEMKDKIKVEMKDKMKDEMKDKMKDEMKNEIKIKDKKHIIANRLKVLCDKCSISNYTLGMYIRGWHIMTPIYTIFLMFYISKLLYRIIILHLLCLLIAFIYFKGCVLTVLEKQLCGDTFTFIDPVLEYYNIELTSKNRYYISLIAAKLYLAVTFTIYFYRFYRF
jgi:hypothetical protein